MARVYLDSCIVIYLIQGSDELNRTITQALRPTKTEPPTAFVGGCQEFWTNDHRLSSAARNRIELKVFSKEAPGQP